MVKRKGTAGHSSLSLQSLDGAAVESGLERRILELASDNPATENLLPYRIAEQLHAEGRSFSINDILKPLFATGKYFTQFSSLYSLRPSYPSLEDFSIIKEHLSHSSTEKLSLYGSAPGSYLLLKDIRAEHDVDITGLSLISKYLRLKDTLAGIIGPEKASSVQRWDPRYLDLTLSDADRILSILKKTYDSSPEIFFERYGASEGVVNMMQELEKEGRSLHGKKIASLMTDPQVISALLHIPDSRFKTHWNPRVIYTHGDQCQTIISHLKQRYLQNPDAFFATYGASIGTALLMTELMQRYSLDVPPLYISSLICDGDALSHMLALEDARFQQEWNPRNIQISSQDLLSLVRFLKEKHNQDSDLFFSRYSSDIGAVHLSEDLKKEQNIDLLAENIVSIASHGRDISLLLGIEDGRFKDWRQRKIYQRGGKLDDLISLLKRRYSEDNGLFFERYGCEEGCYNAARDLRDESGFSKRINLQEVAQAMSSSSTLQSLIGINDARFAASWTPRQFSLHLDTMESLLEFLGRQYHKDADSFFAVYGSTTGAYVLAREMAEKGVPIHLIRLGTLINKGNILARLLGLSDQRFESSWKPRAIQMSLRDVDVAVDFLKEAYNRDSDAFFSRYGSVDGQLVLSRDIEEKAGISVSNLKSIVSDGEALSSFLGIEDSRFSTGWNVNILNYSNNDRIEFLLDFFRSKYELNPGEFFQQYGKMSGILDMARDIHSEKEKDSQLINLSTLFANGKKAANLLGIEDGRFETLWRTQQCKGKFTVVEKSLDYLRSQFAEDPESFGYRYMGKEGVATLANELSSLGIEFKDIIALSFLLTPQVLREQAVPIDQAEEGRQSQHLKSLSTSDMQRMLEHLKWKYADDPSFFFDLYGSSIGRLALGLELGFSSQRGWGSIMSNGTALGQMLQLNDPRFSTHWKMKLGEPLEQLTSRGIGYLARGMDLPALSDPITDDMKDYLAFRYKIQRGHSVRGSLRGGLGKRALLYLTRLISPESHDQLDSLIQDTIARDALLLEEILASPVPAMDCGVYHQRLSPNAIEARKLHDDEHMSTEDIASRLGLSPVTVQLYVSRSSKEEGSPHRKHYTKNNLIRIGQKSGITTSSQWRDTPNLPTLVTISKHFGNWKNFKAAIEDSADNPLTDIEELPLDYVSSDSPLLADPSSSRDFEFRVGRLLYSFEPDIRQRAYSHLLEYASSYPYYQRLIRSKDKAADIAQEVFLKAVASYNPYALFNEDKNEVLELSRLLGGNLKWVPHLARAEPYKNGLHISIQTGGPRSGRLGQDTTSLEEFS
ncbi:MAG TPA: hypothetical protein VJI75_03780 [Candidatus Nanoarchaeia archaeon]|nr:hypothetical protein [Candidatus Nanoarchaeia archaeon]